MEKVLQVSQIRDFKTGKIAVFSSKRWKNYEIYGRKKENVYNVKKKRICMKFGLRKEGK